MSIGEHAEGVGQKELGDLFAVVGQVVVIGGLEFNVAVFQLDEHQRQAVYVDEHVRAAIAFLPADPELRDCEPFIVAGFFEIDELYRIMMAFALFILP